MLKLMGKEIFQMYAEFILPIWTYRIGTFYFKGDGNPDDFYAFSERKAKYNF